MRKPAGLAKKVSVPSLFAEEEEEAPTRKLVPLEFTEEELRAAALASRLGDVRWGLPPSLLCSAGAGRAGSAAPPGRTLSRLTSPV